MLTHDEADTAAYWTDPPLTHLGLFRAMARAATVPDVAELCLETLAETDELAAALASLLRQAQGRIPAHARMAVDLAAKALTYGSPARLSA
jgi:hypothetical protein